MATGKVRIFELAKELNMSSKDMIALFGRLGLEAKNQLSVVDPKVADLLRVQLGKAAAAKVQAAKSAPAAPAGPVAGARAVAPAAPPAPAPAPPAAAPVAAAVTPPAPPVGPVKAQSAPAAPVASEP